MEAVRRGNPLSADFCIISPTYVAECGYTTGPYEVISPLGAGGMGVVYRARDSRLKREVAIKVLPPAFSLDADRLRRFEREALATAALNHPNILAVFDIGTHEGRHTWCPSCSKARRSGVAWAGGRSQCARLWTTPCKSRVGWPQPTKKGSFIATSSPENLFVTKDGRVKILDFGLAKLTEALASRTI